MPVILVPVASYRKYRYNSTYIMAVGCTVGWQNKILGLVGWYSRTYCICTVAYSYWVLAVPWVAIPLVRKLQVAHCKPYCTRTYSTVLSVLSTCRPVVHVQYVRTDIRVLSYYSSGNLTVLVISTQYVPVRTSTSRHSATARLITLCSYSYSYV